MQSYNTAITHAPGYPEAYYSRGNTLQRLARHQDAIQDYQFAITLKPDYASAYNNLGVVYAALNQHLVAIRNYDQAILLELNFANAYNNKGLALHALGHLDAALHSFDMAIQHEPAYVHAYNNRGNVFSDLKTYDAALRDYDQAIALDCDYPFLFGQRLHTKMQICGWVGLDDQTAQLAEMLAKDVKASPPFPVLSITGSLTLQKKAAEIWVQEKYPARFDLPEFEKRPVRERISIGYFSADFYNHATAYLMAELFETHDRSKFSLVAISFGPERDDEMTRRLTAAFDQFFDVKGKSDKDIALLSRSLGIDIAVDLKGHTQHSRPGIFAYRAAPVQVSYIGYPGTLAADYIDYLIADAVVIPPASRPYYSEKIVTLPHSCQANDSKRKIAQGTITRADQGLPVSGFVFCCFNNNYKITPGTFDIWMRILTEVEASVLLLLMDNPLAAEKIVMEAVKRGVSGNRIIFAGRLPLADHLARHVLADLFLDTLPYNAHTTASDALWAGLPVLTCGGDAFASRVAASLLNAIDLPELVAQSAEDYQALAIRLATRPGELDKIKRKLAVNRLTTPLFNSPSFAKHIEDAYSQMYARYQSGLPCADIDVAADC